MKKTLLLFAAGLISAGSFAATLHVDAAGDGETVFRTIGEAAARALPGGRRHLRAVQIPKDNDLGMGCHGGL